MILGIIKLKEQYFFKDKEKDLHLFNLLNPFLVMAFIDLVMYCWKKHQVKLVITRTIAERLPMSVSDTHEEGRAIDISVQGFTIDLQRDLEDYCNNRSPFKEYGAMGIASGVRRLCILHNGTAMHIHLQVGREFNIYGGNVWNSF